jgi:hypothetical protein
MTFGIGKGKRKKAPNLLASVTYHEYRPFLPLKSVLLFFGQSKPEGCRKVSSNSGRYRRGQKVKWFEGIRCINSLESCDEGNAQSIKDFLNSEETPIMHHDIPYDLGYLMSVCISTMPTTILDI